MTPYSGVIKLNLMVSRFDIVYKNKKNISKLELCNGLTGKKTLPLGR
jgi:hypothetical protein